MQNTNKYIPDMAGFPKDLPSDLQAVILRNFEMISSKLPSGSGSTLALNSITSSGSAIELWKLAVADGLASVLTPKTDRAELKIGTADMTGDNGKLTVTPDCVEVGSGLAVTGTSANTYNVDGTYISQGLDTFGKEYWKGGPSNLWYISIESTGSLWYCIHTSVNPVYYDARYTNYAQVQQPVGTAYWDNPYSGQTATVAVSGGSVTCGTAIRATGLSKIDYIESDKVTTDLLSIVPTSTVPAHQEGIVWYNADRNVFQMYTDIPNTMLDVGEETRTRVVNKTGGPLLNGDVVFISGASGSKTVIALADADNDAQTDATIGMLTMDLANNEEGYAVSVGTVHDLNTNAYVDGTILYLSQTPGKWTSTKPLQPASVVQIGIVQNQHANQGEILVDIRKRWAKDVRQLSKQDTGWAPNEYLDSSYDYSTRKITITNTSATTSAYLFWQGTLVLTLAPLGTYVSTAHTATNGSWFHYYNGSSYVWSQTPWTFDMAMLGYVKYVSATPITSFGVTETHSLMDRYVHEELHATIGTYKTAGGTFSGYVLNSTTSANRQVDISSTTLKDEDLSVVNALLNGGTGAYTLGYIAPSSLFTFIDAQDHIVPSGATIPTWNNPATGALTPLTVNQYMNVWVFGIPVMKDATSQKRRYVLLAGQSASTTRATIDAESPNTLILGDLATISAEWNVFGRILLRYTPTGWSLITVNLVNTTKGSVSQTSVSGLTEVSHDSTLVGTGEASTPLGVNPTLTYQSYPLALGTSWIIDHTLASPTPTVTTIDSSGQDIELEVVYDQVTSKRINLFSGHSLSGTVFLT